MTEVNQAFFMMWLFYYSRVKENWVLIFKYSIEKINRRTIRKQFGMFFFLDGSDENVSSHYDSQPLLAKRLLLACGMKSRYSEV